MGSSPTLHPNKTRRKFAQKQISFFSYIDISAHQFPSLITAHSKSTAFACTVRFHKVAASSRHTLKNSAYKINNVRPPLPALASESSFQPHPATLFSSPHFSIILRWKPNHFPQKPLPAMRTLNYIKKKVEFRLEEVFGKHAMPLSHIRRNQNTCPYRDTFQNIPLPLSQNPNRNSSRQRDSFAVVPSRFGFFLVPTPSLILNHTVQSHGNPIGTEATNTRYHPIATHPFYAHANNI